MISFFKKRRAQRALVRALETRAWQQDLNAAYEEDFVRDLAAAIEGHKEEIEKLNPQIEELQGKHEAEKREQKKKLIGNREEREAIIKNIEGQRAEHMAQAANMRQDAAKSRHRANFIRRQ